MKSQRTRRSEPTYETDLTHSPRLLGDVLPVLPGVASLWIRKRIVLDWTFDVNGRSPSRLLVRLTDIYSDDGGPTTIPIRTALYPNTSRADSRLRGVASERRVWTVSTAIQWCVPQVVFPIRLFLPPSCLYLSFPFPVLRPSTLGIYIGQWCG